MVEKPKVSRPFTIISRISKAIKTHSGSYKLQKATKMLCIVFLFDMKIEASVSYIFFFSFSSFNTEQQLQVLGLNVISLK